MDGAEKDAVEKDMVKGVEKVAHLKSRHLMPI